MSGSSAVTAAEPMKTRTPLRLALLDDTPDRVEVDPLVLGVGLESPADVVDPIGDDQHGRPVVEDVALESLQPAGRRVAPQPALMKRTLRSGNRSNV